LSKVIYHNIDDDEKQKEAISAIKGHWDINSKNGKINGKTINQILWENWEKTFDNKTGYEIIEELKRLKKMIDEENPEKKNNSSPLSLALMFGLGVTAKIGYDYLSRKNNETDKLKENDKEKKPSKFK